MKNGVGRSKAGSEIIAALQEISDALSSGRVEEKLTVRTVKLDLVPHAYRPDEVLRTRELLNVSQDVFAQLLGVSSRTVRSWEQGDRPPSAIACRFMDEINRTPDHWSARLVESIRSERIHPAGSK
jgi:putative transcriptional regulator